MLTKIFSILSLFILITGCVPSGGGDSGNLITENNNSNEPRGGTHEAPPTNTPVPIMATQPSGPCGKGMECFGFCKDSFCVSKNFEIGLSKSENGGKTKISIKGELFNWIGWDSHQYQVGPAFKPGAGTVTAGPQLPFQPVEGGDVSILFASKSLILPLSDKNGCFFLQFEADSSDLSGDLIQVTAHEAGPPEESVSHDFKISANTTSEEPTPCP